MNVIEVKNLKFSYNGLQLLEDVNFSVSEGEFVKLTGPNGSGKSTLVKLLIKELTASSGSIKIFGKNIDSFKEWYKIGYLPQNKFGEGNFPATAEEVVLTGFYHEIGAFRFATKKYRQLSFDALKQTGMENFKNCLIGNLSGGQLQRVMLSRLLASKPQIIILDEPLTGVDSTTSTKIYEILGDLRDKGVTIIMIGHDTIFSDDIIDKTYCLAYGSLIELDKIQIKREIACKHVHPHQKREENGNI